MPNTNQNIRNTQYFRVLAEEMRVLADDTRQVELSFSSEQPYERWFGVEILSHDDGAIELARLAEVGALLFHHGRDPNLGSIPVGRIISVRLDASARKGKAVVEFDSDEKSDLIFQKVKNGAIRGVSVGYRIGAYEEVKPGSKSANGRFEGPCTVVTKWTPYEISIEPTPADDTVGVGRSYDTNQTKGENQMNENNLQNPQSAPALPVAPAADEAQLRAQAAEAERMRITEITAMCRDFDMSPDEYIAGNRSIEEVRASILEQQRAARVGQRAIPAANAEVTKDEEDKFRSAARDAQLLRMGIPVSKPADGAAEMRGLSLRSLAAACLQRSGIELFAAERMDDERLLRAALGFDETRGILTPDSAFVSVINNTMGAVISHGYNTANTTFQLWCGKGSNPNFKPAKRFRLSAAGEMVEVNQNGEFKHDSVRDEGVDTLLKTYGKKFGFTRQTFINDDLGTIAKAILAQTRSGKRTINKQVYKIIGENAKYIDGKPLFHADHKNLGTAGALSTTTLGELYVLMSLQKDLSDKERLNLTPKFGLFPAALTMEAWKLLNSISDPEAQHAGVVNPMQGKILPIIDAELDQYGAGAFYTVADANDVDTIEVSYLNGKEEPTLESRVSWDVLGIEYRMYHDWAVSLLDYRGLNKNSGK